MQKKDKLPTNKTKEIKIYYEKKSSLVQLGQLKY